MRRTEVFDLVLTSIFAAIILLLALTPQIGFITILPGVALTIVHIPTLIGIFILKPKYGLLLGVVFGLGSLIASYMYAATPFDLAFQNPLISVLPRALFGLASWGIFIGLSNLAKIKFGNYIIFGFVALITSFAVYFGSLAIADNAIWNDYNQALAENAAWEADHDILDLFPPHSQNDLNALQADALQTKSAVESVLIPLSLVVIAVFITGYYALVSNEKYEDLVVPASFVLGTVAHTVLVLTFVILLAESFQMAFGDAVTIIYGIAASNGLIEALAAVAIGTPIYYVIRQLPQIKRLNK